MWRFRGPMKTRDRQNIGQKKKGQTKVYKTKDRVTQNWNGKQFLLH